jgi:hypothetical protein
MVILLVAMLFGAGPARAVEIDEFKVTQATSGERPQIHVKFDLQADNWNAATTDPFKLSFLVSITLRKLSPLVDGSDFTLTFDKLKKVIDLADYGAAYKGQMFGFTINFNQPASTLGDIKYHAVTLCREIRSNGAKPNKPYVFVRNAPAFADVFVQVAAKLAAIKTAQAQPNVSYDVVCDANPDWHEPIVPVPGIATNKGPFEVKSLDLFVATLAGQDTHPNPATSCNKAKVTVRIETNKIGAVSYTLWRMPGEPVKKQKLAVMLTEGPDKGRFIIEDIYIETFDKTTYAQYMVEVTNNAFSPSTQWKPITIHCNSSYSSGQPQGGAGELIEGFKVTKTELKIIGTGDKGCPAKAFVTATFFANKPGDFDYLIGTSLGASKHGKLQAKKVGSVYRAQGR